MDDTQQNRSEKSLPQERTSFTDEYVTLSTIKFSAILASICSVSFFIGFDSTCVGTIAPNVTDSFNSPGDIGCLLASCSTILSWGKLYSFYPERIIFGLSICIFVLGSILCAAAHSSPTFIVGRTIAGLGNGGALSGCNIVISRITPLARRPLYLGIVGGVECFALSIAPLLAGIITKYSSWRVCFYLSIPFGVMSALIVITMMNLPKTTQQSGKSIRQKFAQLDFPGMAIFIPCVICLVFALQWGGIVYAWNDTRIIVLLAFFGILAIAFIIEQYFANIKSRATIPITILKSRTVLFVVSYAFSTAAALNLYEYYVPIFYQGVQGLSTLGSGIRDLGRMLGLTASLLLVGIITSKIGFYNPAMILGTILMCIGTGLTTTFRPDTAAVNAIAYQTILGVGCGFAFQQPIVAVQGALSQELIPSAIVLVSFMQSLGSIVSLAIAQNLFRGTLLQGITGKLPAVKPDMLLNAGVLDLKSMVPLEDLKILLDVYSDALKNTFFVGMGFACATAIGAFCTKWDSIKVELEKGEVHST